MNKKFNFIINTLIIILIIALVVVMMDYYANTESIPTLEKDFINNQEIISPSGDIKKENTIINIETNNEEKEIDFIEQSGDMNIIEVESGDNSGDVVKETTEVRPEKKNESPVIMSSENEISSKEKGEILTELDKTLMELLDVVDRVQVVDETRLITDDSEVQK